MVWKLQFTEIAAKQFKKLNKSIAKQLIDYLKDRVCKKEDPTLTGKPFLGDEPGLWRYRVEDYRIICKIEEKELTVLVIKLGHRKGVYD